MFIPAVLLKSAFGEASKTIFDILRRSACCYEPTTAMFRQTISERAFPFYSGLDGPVFTLCCDARRRRSTP
jgi:hypothetical protein